MAKTAASPTVLISKPQAKPRATTPSEKTTASPQAKVKPATPPIVKPVTQTVAKAAVAKAAVAKVAVAKAAIEKVVKAKKPKQTRDSFTMPKTEYAVLGELKERAASLKHSVKKSELLRAGIKALAAMTDADLLKALKAVPVIKTGRPKK